LFFPFFFFSLVQSKRLDRQSSECLKAVLNEKPKCLLVLVTRPIEEYPESLGWLSPYKKREATASALLEDFHWIPLGGLRREECEELIIHVFGDARASTVDADFLDKIISLTQGCPLFVEQILITMIDDGRIWVNGGGVVKTTGSNVENIIHYHSALNLSVGKAILHQFNQLDPQLQSILRAASVAGQFWSVEEINSILQVCGQTPLTLGKVCEIIAEHDKFEFVQIEETSEIDARTMQDGGTSMEGSIMNPADDQGSLRGVDSEIQSVHSANDLRLDEVPTVHPSGVFAFRHVVLQSSIYASLLSGERCQYHAAIAKHYESLKNLQENLPRIAYHYCFSDDYPKRFAYGEMLIKHYMDLHLPLEALSILRKSIELASEVGAEKGCWDLPRLGALWHKKAFLHLSLYEFEQAEQASLTALRNYGVVFPRSSVRLFAEVLVHFLIHRCRYLRPAERRLQNRRNAVSPSTDDLLTSTEILRSPPPAPSQHAAPKLFYELVESTEAEQAKTILLLYWLLSRSQSQPDRHYLFAYSCLVSRIDAIPLHHETRSVCFGFAAVISLHLNRKDEALLYHYDCIESERHLRSLGVSAPLVMLDKFKLIWCIISCQHRDLSIAVESTFRNAMRDKMVDYTNNVASVYFLWRMLCGGFKRDEREILSLYELGWSRGEHMKVRLTICLKPDCKIIQIFFISLIDG
jgi:hypothetical protein